MQGQLIDINKSMGEHSKQSSAKSTKENGWEILLGIMFELLHNYLYQLWCINCMHDHFVPGAFFADMHSSKMYILWSVYWSIISPCIPLLLPLSILCILSKFANVVCGSRFNEIYKPTGQIQSDTDITITWCGGCSDLKDLKIKSSWLSFIDERV